MEQGPGEGDDGAGEVLGEEELEKKYKPSKLVTMMVRVPLCSKSSSEALAGTQELFTRLRRHGYPVGRIHTDAGREFENGSFRRRCLERGLARTTSCPDEHAQSGRVEAAINSIKQRVRRLLHGAVDEKLPFFGQQVVVKKRSWELQRQGAFENTGEQVTYLTPVSEVSKGHAVLTDRDTIKIVSYTIKDTKEPVADRHDLQWEEVEAGGDPV